MWGNFSTFYFTIPMLIKLNNFYFMKQIILDLKIVLNTNMFAAQRKSNRKSVIGNVYQKWKNPLTKRLWEP